MLGFGVSDLGFDPMGIRSLTCDRCHAVLQVPRLPDAPASPCPRCGVPTRVLVFPALFRPPPLPDAGTAAMPAEAACFYHAGKRAFVPCDACGRFLCALCDVEWQGRHLCTPCLEASQNESGTEPAQGRRVLYDSIALSLAVLPLIFILPFFMLTLLTAPLSVYFAIRALRQPRGPIPGRRLRAMVALVLGIAEICGWLVFGVIAINRMVT
jgi:hypothetical protein